MERFHSKIGDVFEVVDRSPTRYVQLVHIDPVQMNSDVVVVYGSGREGLDFYTHTTVEQGIQEGLWVKSDRKPRDINLAELSFKLFMEDEFDEGVEPYWQHWTCADAEWHTANLRDGMLLNGVDGSVYPATDILYRIDHGQSEFKQDWPNA